MEWSFQLFSARETPIDEALRIVSEAGYSSVEAYRDNFTDSETFKRALDKYALSVPSQHINLEDLRADLTACIRRVREFDSQLVVCPYLDVAQRPGDTPGWAKLAKELGSLNTRWQDEGITFAWHNHDFEFVSMSDGQIPMQILLDEAEDIMWEIDVAWIVRAGADPTPWIEQHSERLAAVHLKDIAVQGECLDEDGWADFGYGVLPWQSLMKQLVETSAGHFIMEHDKPNDLERFTNRSIEKANLYLG